MDVWINEYFMVIRSEKLTIIRCKIKPWVHSKLVLLLFYIFKFLKMLDNVWSRLMFTFAKDLLFVRDTIYDKLLSKLKLWVPLQTFGICNMNIIFRESSILSSQLIVPLWTHVWLALENIFHKAF